MMWVAKVSGNGEGTALVLEFTGKQFKNQAEFEADMRANEKDYEDNVSYTLYHPRPVCSYETIKQRKIIVETSVKDVVALNKSLVLKEK
jgi:hypothetical protein